jgi:hypothetical protein
MHHAVDEKERMLLANGCLEIASSFKVIQPLEPAAPPHEMER